MIPGAQMSHPMLELSVPDFVGMLRLSQSISGHLVDRAEVIASRPSFQKFNSDQREDFDRVLNAAREAHKQFSQLAESEEKIRMTEADARKDLVGPALLPLETVIGFTTVLIKGMSGPLPNPDYFGFLGNIRTRANALHILWCEILGTHYDDLWAPTYDHLDTPTPTSPSPQPAD